MRYLFVLVSSDQCLQCEARLPARSCEANAMTVVVPPAIALRVPVSQLSPVGEFFCARWTWLSTPPGVIYAPSASIALVAAEMGRLVPMHEILPFLMPISSPSDRTSLAVTCRLSAVSRFAMAWSLSFTHNYTVLDNQIKIHGVRSAAKTVVRNFPLVILHFFPSTTLLLFDINILYLLSPDITPTHSHVRAC